MEIRRYYCYVFINCVIIPFIFSKSISLNDLIAAEEKRASMQQPQLKVPEAKTITKEFSKDLRSRSSILTGNRSPIYTKLSPLKYKKTFQIRTPLRPKKIKYSSKLRSRSINPAARIEIYDDEKFNRNYIPLLKSLTVLFNNILSSDSREDDTEQSYNRHHLSESHECPCAYKSGDKIKQSGQEKKATTSSSSITTKIPSKTIADPEASSTSTHTAFYPNFGTLRRNKNLPILLTRNSTSSRRNYHGLRKGGLSTHHRNLERHITGNNGNGENNNSPGRETESDTENHKRNTNSTTGDSASCNGSCGTIGGDRNITEVTEDETLSTETSHVGTNETTTYDRRDSNQFEGLNKFEAGSNEAESRALLSKPNSRLRGHNSQEETTELSQQIENLEESTFDVTYNITRDQRVPDRDGSVAEKDQEFRRSNKKLTPDLTKSLFHKPSAEDQDKQKIVVIYDGYSIARDVNGANKLTEKAVRIHS